MTLVKKSKLLILFTGLGLALLAFVACGSNGAAPEGTRPAGGQWAAWPDLAGLLRSEIGASAFERLIQGDVGTPSSRDAGIWVTGRGEASAEPDLAVLILGVEAFASTVAEARTDGASAMGRMLEVIKSQGVADRDIQTRSFSIRARNTTKEITRCTTTENLDEIVPELETRHLIPPVPPTEDELDELAAEAEYSRGGLEIQVAPGEKGEECVVEFERVILGYDVTNQLLLKVRDLFSIGDIIDQTTEAGGDLARFQGVSFTIEDTNALQVQARTAAVKDLIAKASQVASLAGVQLGSLVFVSETGSPVVRQSVSVERLDFTASAAPTPIQAGELNVVVSLQGAFNIQHPEE